MKKSKKKAINTEASTKKPSGSRVNNITRRNKHAKSPIAYTLQKHLRWCTDPDDRAYPSYGAKGRRIASELTYTNDGPTNEAIIEKVMAKIGEKPKPHKNYHLHVDWEATGGVMTLDNIAWVTASDNTKMQSSNIRLSNGLELCKEAKAIGLKPTTATARVRNGQAHDTVLSLQLRADIDFHAQRQKHEMIDALIKQGKLFVTKEGQLFIVPEIGEPFSRKTRIEKTGYHSVALMLNGRKVRVQFSHVVLIQYAGLPPQDDTDLKTVWNADHIDGDKDNNRPDNLCWLPVSENTGIKKSGSGINNNVNFVQALAKKGLAIISGESMSPHSDDIIERRKAEVNAIKRDNSTWKSCVRAGWVALPELSFIQKVADTNPDIPSHLLVRFALVPGNAAKRLNADIEITCSKTGRRYALSELAWNCRGHFHYVFFTRDVSGYLEDNHAPGEVEHIINTLPGSAMFEKQSICLRTYHRARDNQDDITADFIEHDFINAQLSKTLLCASPATIESLYDCGKNETPNPLLLSPGSTSECISVRCALCGGPTERVTVKSIVRAQKQGEGRLCERCNAISRAQNGLSS